jgi:hypothetical protein
MSEVHCWSIHSGANSRFTRSGGYVAEGSGVVVTLKSPGLTPAIPRLAMRTATVLRLTRSPASWRFEVIRGAP